LPVPYFHVVFTLPDTLNRLSLYKPKILYDLLFKISWSVLNSFGHDPKWLGAKPGIVSILHTNGQDLSFHPHIHCIVSGGGINAAGNWVKEKRANGNYLFPKPKMENEYKLYLLKKLQTLLHQQKLATADAAALKITLEYWGKVHIQNIHHRPPH